jgi:predicted aspartyl protease
MAGLPDFLPNGGQESCKPFDLLWDTGATNTVITPQVVQTLELKPFGKVQVRGVNSITECNTYLIDIVLPNNLRVKEVKVSENPVEGCDILIGMDIIGLGDFSIANGEGVTLFSFLFPAHHNKIDLLEKCNKINPKIKIHT